MQLDHKFAHIATLQSLLLPPSRTQPHQYVPVSLACKSLLDQLSLTIQVNMIILYFLFLQHLVLVSPSEGSYEVGLSADAAFFESCIDLTSLYDAISHLESVKSVFSQYLHTFKGSNRYLANLAGKIESNLDSELTAISRKLSQYGFARDINYELKDSMRKFNTAFGGRSKRGAFDFVSEGASYLFGFVSASQYQNLKANIKDQFDIIQDHESQLQSAAALNRDHMNKALASLQSFQREFQSFTKGFADRWQSSEKLLGVAIQVTYALSSVQSLVATLGTVRSNSDHFYPSRFLSPKEELVAYLLQLSDSLRDVSPVFSSTQADSYFRYQIATTTSLNNNICQLLKIPLISHFGKFNIAHSKNCPSGSVCLSNHLGNAQLDMTQYTSCLGVRFHDLPSLCTARPCLVSEDISCVMLNLTSALVATKHKMSVTIKCTHKTTIEIHGIAVIMIPLNCLIHSQNLKIDRVQTMKARRVEVRVIKLPFVIEESVLHVNSQSLGLPIFENNKLAQLILPKLKTSFDSEHFSWRSHVNFGVSTAAGVICSLLLCCLALYLSIKRCKRRSPGTSKGNWEAENTIELTHRAPLEPVVKVENEIEVSSNLGSNSELHPFNSRRNDN